MQQQHAVSLSRFFLVGVLVLAAVVLPGRHHSREAHGNGQPDRVKRQAEDVCLGFVVLPNGFAVLSGLPVSPTPSSAGGRYGAARAGATLAGKGPTSGAPQHLLGYIHGQEIVPRADMLCVSIGDAGTLRWLAVGDKAAPTITIESLQGAPTHGSGVSAAFALTMRQDGVFVDTAQMRLLARMPHHDRHMPSGHGPANDPDVKGIIAQPVGQGRYTIAAVDFTMGGPWLLEIHVRRGSGTHKTYFAVYVGEE
jgi:hypothetical protein